MLEYRPIRHQSLFERSAWKAFRFFFWYNQSMRQIGRNIFSLGLSRIVSGIIIFVVYIRLVTYLGPTDFGKFSLVLAYYTIFLLLVDLGVQRYVVKKISEDENRASLYLGNFFIAQILISSVVLLAFIIIPKFLHYEPLVGQAMFVAGVGLLVGSLSNPFSALVQAQQRIHIVAAVNFVNTIINAAWLLYAVFSGQNIVFIFWVYTLVGMSGLIIYRLNTRAAPLKLELDWPLVRRMLLFGLPFAFISGFEMLVAKLDIVLQKFFLPFAQVGLYSGAYRFIDALTFIPAVVAISLFPYLASKSDLKTPEVREVMNRWNRYMMALAIPLGVGGTILADKIILGLFDERYLGSVLPFQILIWSSVLTFIYAVPNVMMIVKQVRKSVAILAVATIFNFAANLIFIPKFGILASAWITVASYLFVALAYIFYAGRIADFKLWKFGLWPVIASAVMGFVVWQIREINPVVSIGAGIMVYLAVLAIARFLKREDLEFAKSIFSRKSSRFPLPDQIEDKFRGNDDPS